MHTLSAAAADAEESPPAVEPLDPFQGWPVTPGCLQSVREADWHTTGPDHPFAPLIAFLRANGGDTVGGLALARRLRRQPLRTGAEHAARTADLVIVRLWSARLEARTDHEAMEAAQGLCADPGQLDAMRRALVNYELAIALLSAGPAVDAAVLDNATAHLALAVTLARTIGFDSLTVAALSRTALLEVPRGRLAAAERWCDEALAIAGTTPGVRRPAHWRARLLLVRNWARYYQGEPVDTAEVKRCVAVVEGRSETTILPLASAVAALALLQEGDSQGARQELQRALSNPRLLDLGIWRLPLLIIDGYLAIVSGDLARTAECVTELTQVPAPAEALLLRALQLAEVGDHTSGLAALRPITSRSVRTHSITFPVACALEAALHETLGATNEAERSMRQALATAEPLNALRVFSLHDSELSAPIIERVMGSKSRTSWALSVIEYLERETTPAEMRLGIGTIGQAHQENLGDVTTILSMGSPLTEREMQVLALVNEGASQARMAKELYVSLNTIKTHLRSIRKKLGVERTGEAAALARKAGWLAPDSDPR